MQNLSSYIHVHQSLQAFYAVHPLVFIFALKSFPPAQFGDHIQMLHSAKQSPRFALNCFMYMLAK